MCECRCLWRSENGIESFGAGVIGGFPPLMWVLGSKWSFATAVSTLSCWPISPALDCLPFVHAVLAGGALLLICSWTVHLSFLEKCKPLPFKSVLFKFCYGILWELRNSLFSFLF